jgi:mannose-6-phosphate isomerase-like protein (cupin superfamily)
VIRVQQGQDRFNERIPIGAKSSIDRKMSAKDTGGLWSMFEAHWCLKGGPPLHFHHGEDEWFYVIEGEYLVQVGNEKFNLRPGDSLLAPGKFLIPTLILATGKVECYWPTNQLAIWNLFF